MSEEEFVSAVTEGLPEPPAYFSEEVALNRTGHQSFDPADPIEMVDHSTAVERAARGALLLDVRDDQAFAAGHLRGAVNVGLSGRVAEYAAGVRAPRQQVVLFGSKDQVSEARLRLARVGVDTVVAAVASPGELGARPDLVEASSRLDAEEARRRLEAVGALQVIDVRNPGELADGALPGCTNIPLPRLRARLGELDPQRPVLVYCAGGYRAMAAASMLKAAGFTDVSDMVGGYSAWLTSQAGATVSARSYQIWRRSRTTPGGIVGYMINSTDEDATTGQPRLPLEKALNLLAGTVVLSSLTLARRGRPRWRVLTGFVGANLLLSGVVGWCPTSLLLHRLGLRSSCELAHGHSSGRRLQ